MLRRTLACIMSLILPQGATGATSACEVGAKLQYPLSQVLLAEARTLSLSQYRHADSDKADGSAYRAVVEAALAPLGPLEADVRLLALIDAAGGALDGVMPSLTTLSPSTMVDRFLDVLDRRGLPVQARALRVAREAFATWDGTPESRRLQLISKDGMIADPGLMALLDTQTKLWRAARPSVIDRAAELVTNDSILAIRYEAARLAADDDARLIWLMRQIHDCADQDWLTPREADNALAHLPSAQRDLLLLDMFIAEIRNGGGIQLYHNSTGTLLPQLVEVMERHGFADHAARLRRVMAEFPTPYPRDTRDRRAVLETFTDLQMGRIDDLMDIALDPALTSAMVRIAKQASIWPS